MWNSLDPDPNPIRGKILYPDPIMLYLVPQHCLLK